LITASNKTTNQYSALKNQTLKKSELASSDIEAFDSNSIERLKECFTYFYSITNAGFRNQLWSGNSG